MQIVDNTSESYAPLLKETLRELLAYASAQRLKGIRLVILEVGAERPNGKITTRYTYKDGQGTVHVELGSILRLADGMMPLEWRVWALGRKAAHALSFALANHSLRGSRPDLKMIEDEARRIQLELLKSWSERWVAKVKVPSLLKGLLSRLVAHRLAVMARRIRPEGP